MDDIDSLTQAFNEWFDRPLGDLPEQLRLRVEQEFIPMSWDSLSPNQRRNIAIQLDGLHDPAAERERKFWWGFFEREDALKKQLTDWESVSAHVASDLATKEARIREIREELARMDARKRADRGDAMPLQKAIGKPSDNEYIAYPKALHLLNQRLGVTPDEMAAWIWLTPEHGGIAAYLNANELSPPPRFFFSEVSQSQDYIGPMMACWFLTCDIEQFVPTERYITGVGLIKRWNMNLGTHALAFIQAKVDESRLLDIHPIYGGTRGTSNDVGLPPLETGLFSLAQVEKIEAEDFEQSTNSESERAPRLGTNEWHKANAKAAANARHAQPGGSREKHEQILAIWATGKYSSKDLCAEQECAALNMSFSTARKALRGA